MPASDSYKQFMLKIAENSIHEKKWGWFKSPGAKVTLFLEDICTWSRCNLRNNSDLRPLRRRLYRPKCYPGLNHAKNWMMSHLETLGTHMLGVLSVALGLAAAMGMPLIWFGFNCFSQEVAVWLDLPPEGLGVALPQPDPSFAGYCGIAIVGQFLGMAGVGLSMRLKGPVSILSIIGTVLCVIAIFPLYLFMIIPVLILILPILLPVLGLTTISNILKQGILADDRQRRRGVAALFALGGSGTSRFKKKKLDEV
jgi:hypothetical protein